MSPARKPETLHRCPVCRRTILLKFLMCAEHWAMVPRVLQTAIWREYYYAQRHKKPFSDAYSEAVEQATHHVAARIAEALKGAA